MCARAAEACEGSVDPRTVLLVEDDTLIAMDAEDALEERDFVVCGVARTEDKAVELGSSLRPQYAIVDVGLESGSGRNVARALAEQGGTAILMVTSEPAHTLHGIGAHAYLGKPYQCSALAAALAAARTLACGMIPDRMPSGVVALNPS
jgi:two-component system, response regulator PdtaR